MQNFIQLFSFTGKSILVLMVWFSIAFNIHAKTVDVQTAKTAGFHFILQKKDVIAEDLKLAEVVSCENNPLYYIFDVATGGFVIVSADDRVVPVLGYSTTGKWKSITDTTFSNNVAGWLDYYERQILSVIEKNLPASPEIENQWQDLSNNTWPVNTTSVNPLLTTTWNQTWPYNELCPGGSMVGCVGIAMAQIMKYWGNPTQGLGSYSYTQGGYGTISADFGATTYNWTNMPNSITSSNADVATICFHAACAVGSIFGTGSTGVMWYNAQEPMTRAFINYFKYSFSTMQFVSKTSYSDTDWENLLKAELDVSRPVFYGGEGTSGHAWVCDGYEGTNYFHFNWGWGGQYNGYFYLNNINPGSNTFNNYQQAIIGIKPNDGSTIVANTTWSGTQTKTTRIAVADGITLTLNPGAVIKFAQDTWLQVYGTLNAVGTQADSVTITSVDTNQNNRWHGIVLDNDYMNRTVMSDNDTTRFIYAKVQYTDDHGLYLSYINRLRIDHSRFLRCVAPTQGGAIYSNTSAFNTRYGKFEKCASAGGSGGAIFIQHSTPQNYQIIGNTFIKDYAVFGLGGAIFLGSGNQFTNILGNIFYSCSAGNGAAVGCQGGNPNITSNQFYNNTTTMSSKASLHLNYCNARVNNNIFTNNEGGAILFTQGSSGPFNNNTIVNNHSIVGAGINCANGSSPTGKNNILWGNQSNSGSQQVFLSNYDCDPNFYYCNIQGGTTSFSGMGAGSYYTGTYENNLDAIPNFVFPTGGIGTSYNGLTADWHLQLGSSCIDAGTPDTTGLYLPATDIYGSPRVFNNHVDIGAAENQCNPPAQPSVITGNITPDQFTSQNYSITDTPGISYQWTFPEGWVKTDGGTTHSVTVTVGLTPGNITVTPSNSVCEGPPRTLAVTPMTLFVTPMTRGVTGTAGSTTFTVTASGNWTASSDQAWCTVTLSGIGNGTIEANWTPNPSATDSRTANITVTMAGLSPVVVSVIQAGTQFKVLNVKAFLESLYLAGGVMRQAMDENGPHFGTGIADQVTVELHDSINYSNIVFSATNVNMSTAGNISIVNIPASCTGYYHLTIRHRNSIETTSVYCVQGAYNSMEYDFTTSQWMAWGQNLKSASGKWLIYGGDVNQDGIVDSGDINSVENASIGVTLGYTVEDANGDGIVDSGDMNMVDNNSMAIIIAITP